MGGAGTTFHVGDPILGHPPVLLPQLDAATPPDVLDRLRTLERQITDLILRVHHLEQPWWRRLWQWGVQLATAFR